MSTGKLLIETMNKVSERTMQIARLVAKVEPVEAKEILAMAMSHLKAATKQADYLLALEEPKDDGIKIRAKDTGTTAATSVQEKRPATGRRAPTI